MDLLFLSASGSFLAWCLTLSPACRQLAHCSGCHLQQMHCPVGNRRREKFGGAASWKCSSSTDIKINKCILISFKKKEVPKQVFAGKGGIKCSLVLDLILKVSIIYIFPEFSPLLFTLRLTPFTTEPHKSIYLCYAAKLWLNP